MVSNRNQPTIFSGTRTIVSFTIMLALSFSAATSYGMDKELLEKVVQSKGCASCHGTRGQGIPSMLGPQLAGQSFEQLQMKLKEYRSGIRKNPTMNVMTFRLSDEEITQLASYFSQFK